MSYASPDLDSQAVDEAIAVNLDPGLSAPAAAAAAATAQACSTFAEPANYSRSASLASHLSVSVTPAVAPPVLPMSMSRA